MIYMYIQTISVDASKFKSNISLVPSIDPHKSVGWDLNPFDNLDDSHRTCHNDPERALLVFCDQIGKSGQLKVLALKSESLHVASFWECGFMLIV